jgi:hypothetical protein
MPRVKVLSAGFKRVPKSAIAPKVKGKVEPFRGWRKPGSDPKAQKPGLGPKS